ncbi:MAG: hypothetical protein H7202_10080 [Pedobacter sp.]|nr:hypothetical protein [Pedobacter sp.]
MKFRLTPLNIITSMGFVGLALSYYQTKPAQIDISPLYRIILVSMIGVSIVTDFIFRFLFKELKRIWLVELVFISLTIILFLLLQK